MHKLKWVIPNVLAGGQHPLLNEEFNLVDSPDWYTEHGIKSVISVFEAPLSNTIINLMSWKYTFQPTDDGKAPQNLYKLCKSISNDGPTFIHCFAGVGRTATVLAAYLLHSGYANTAKEAILKLRKYYNKGAVHTPEQYLNLLDFNQENKTQDEINNDIKELFKKNHNNYSGLKKYKNIIELTKRETKLISDKFGVDSLEYIASQEKLEKLEKILTLFLEKKS